MQLDVAEAEREDALGNAIAELESRVTQVGSNLVHFDSLLCLRIQHFLSLTSRVRWKGVGFAWKNWLADDSTNPIGVSRK